jgi:hypothetical protein
MRPMPKNKLPDAFENFELFCSLQKFCRGNFSATASDAFAVLLQRCSPTHSDQAPRSLCNVSLRVIFLHCNEEDHLTIMVLPEPHLLRGRPLHRLYLPQATAFGWYSPAQAQFESMPPRTWHLSTPVHAHSLPACERIAGSAADCLQRIRRARPRANVQPSSSWSDPLDPAPVPHLLALW